MKLSVHLSLSRLASDVTFHPCLLPQLCHSIHCRVLSSQWENLLHLDTIKARSKPLQPLKKPEAAPFFLPTVPTLAGQPTFDTAGANGTAGTAGGEGGDTTATATAHNIDDSDDDGGNAGSRVLRSRKGAASAAAAPSAFVALLRSSASAGDFAGFMGHVRTLSPAALDRELRGMMVLGGDDPEDAQQQREVAGVGLLLEALLSELDAARNFELVQALTSRVLTVCVRKRLISLSDYMFDKWGCCTASCTRDGACLRCVDLLEYARPLVHLWLPCGVSEALSRCPCVLSPACDLRTIDRCTNNPSVAEV
jgi:hypothetical protein